MDSSDLTAQDSRYVLHHLQEPGETHQPVATQPDGSWLDIDGQRTLDFASQSISLGIGHANPHIRRRLIEALEGMPSVGELFGTPERVEASRLLIEETLEGSDHWGRVRLVCSGSEAMETAMAYAKMYTGRPIVVTREAAYHGWTEGAGRISTSNLTRSFRPAGAEHRRRADIADAPAPAAPAPMCARCPIGHTYPECKAGGGQLPCVRATENVIRTAGVDRVAAFVTELLAGSGGYFVPEEYPAQIREMTERLGILWIDDEIVAGNGRTGRWWAFQHYEVEPDIFATGKGLTASATPGGACVVSREIGDELEAGYVQCGSSFASHPLVATAAAAHIELIRDENVLADVLERGAWLGDRLRAMAERHRSVQSVAGRGFAWILEIVKDPDTGELWVPEDRWLQDGVDPEPELDPVHLLSELCAADGVLIVPWRPNTLLVTPPLGATLEELEIGMKAIDTALTTLDERAADST